MKTWGFVILSLGLLSLVGCGQVENPKPINASCQRHKEYFTHVPKSMFDLETAFTAVPGFHPRLDSNATLTHSLTHNQLIILISKPNSRVVKYVDSLPKQWAVSAYVDSEEPNALRMWGPDYGVKCKSINTVNLKLLNREIKKINQTYAPTKDATVRGR